MACFSTSSDFAKSHAEAVLVGGALVFALVFGISVQLGQQLKQGGTPASFRPEPSCRRYAAACNLDGKDPDGVPFISNITKNVVDRPGVRSSGFPPLLAFPLPLCFGQADVFR